MHTPARDGRRESARILYLAVADARGHLMRAHLLRGLFARRGIDVDVVSTSDDGVAFLRALGTPCTRISDGFRLVYDGAHNLDRRASEARVARYLCGGGARADLATLAARAGDAALVVDDSLHPALVAAPLLDPATPAWRRIVHVHGENLLAATLDHLDGRAPRPLAALYRRALRALLGRAHGEIIHSLAPGGPSPDPDGAATTNETSCRLAPLLAAPRRVPAEVRRRLGVPAAGRLAAVYLNPHFRDAGLWRALGQALRGRGYTVYAVGEGSGGAADRAVDSGFIDVVAAADLLVSGAGMGAAAQALVLGVPFLALLGDQPEQQRNAAQLARALRSPLRALDLGHGGGTERLARALDDALDALDAPTAGARPDARLAIARLHADWIAAFERLLVPAFTTKEEIAHADDAPVIPHPVTVPRPARARRRGRQAPPRTAAARGAGA